MRCLLFLSFLFSCSFLSGQNNAPIKFGKIAPADLKMAVYEPDSTAEAVVLCDFETVIISINDNVMVRKKRHRRIKILDKKGFDYGNVNIPFYSYGKRENFFFDEAMIFLPNGNFQKLDKKDIFIEKINEYWSQARFTFPKIEVGCIIEYSYFINSTSWYEPEDWFFQEAIPVRYSELRFKHDDRLEYIFFFQGNENMEKIKEEPTLTVLEGQNGRCTIKPGVYVFENAPAMREESFVTTMDDYRARIRFQLSKIQQGDGRIEEVTSTWEELRKELVASPYFGFHYLKKGFYKDIVEQVSPALAGISAPKEKVDFIYKYITQNVQWNGGYSIYGGEDKLKAVFEKGVASSGQLNLMLLVLLRAAGIAAEPVLTSTRTHGKMYEDYPLLDQFNHLLIFAEVDGKPLILDATDPLRPIGYPDVEALNKRGWNIEKGWIDIEAPKQSIDLFLSELALTEEGHLTGQMIGVYRGYNSVPERKQYFEDPSGQHWAERLGQKYAEVNLKEVRVNEYRDIGQRLTDTIHFEIQQAAMAANDFLYFSPVLFSSFDENPFKLKERNYPVDFPYNIREQHNIKVKLPNGYVTEEVPKSIRFILPDKGGSFTYAVNDKTPGELAFNISFQVKQLKFYPEEYRGIRELFDLFVSKLDEQVVLKKQE
ncbi:MAG: DUF3857 domain-containing protein [Bacteroidota bacterium]